MNLPKFNVPGISMPSAGGGNSFTRQLAVDERNREVDAENLRRFEIVQATRQRAEDRDIQKFGLDMENAKMRNQVSGMALSEAQEQRARQKMLPELLNSVATEATKELDERYRIVNENPNYTQSEKDIAIQKMNDRVVNAYDAGDLDLNKISNPNQYKEDAAHKMIQEGYDHATIDSTLKTLTSPIEAGIAANQTSLNAGLEFADQIASDEIKKLDEKGGSSGYKPAQIDAGKIFTKEFVDELDNPWQNAYESRDFKKNSKGEYNFSFDDNNRLVGDDPGERASFLADAAKQKFTYKKTDGSTAERHLTKNEIELLAASSYNSGGLLADALDAEIFFKNAQKHVNDVGSSGYSKSLKTIHKNQSEARDALAQKYQRETGEDAINKILGAIKKKP